jgi:hypothetical protein
MPEPDISYDQAAFLRAWLYRRAMFPTFLEQGMFDRQVVFARFITVVLVNVAVSMAARPDFC